MTTVRTFSVNLQSEQNKNDAGIHMTYAVNDICSLEVMFKVSPQGLTARAPMMRALVMCKCEQAHANQRTSQQYSSKYSPEVETDKPFKRKRKEKDLDGKVLCVHVF